MINPSVVRDLEHHLLNASRVLILTHQQPDADAIGSAIAWALQLEAQGISSYIWAAEKLYDLFDYMPSVSLVQNALPKFNDFDTLLVVDCSSASRIKDFDLLNLDLNGMTVINIDHHPDNDYFGNVNIVELISSVGELSSVLFSMLNWTITPDIATCLYAALLFDTGCFTNTNVTPQTFRLSATLLEQGARAMYVTEQMFESFSPASFETLRVGLERLIIRDGYAYSTLTKEIFEGPVKLIDFIRKLSGIQVAIVFREMENDIIKVNLRSKTLFSVSKFASLFGGGGHHRAAGIMLQGPLQDIEAQICSRLETVLNDPAYHVA
jgi:phosphoesterase RecJ-like protein